MAKRQPRYPGESWVALWNGPETLDLFENDPDAFKLLTLIAMRANGHPRKNVAGCLQFQAFIGRKDLKILGWTYSRYRNVKKNLEKYGFAAFQGTNKGTIATIENTDIFDVSRSENGKPDSNPATTQRQPSDNPATPNEIEDRRIKSKEEGTYGAYDDAVSYNYKKKAFVGLDEPTICRWEDTYNLIDVRAKIKRLGNWLNDHPDQPKKDVKSWLHNLISKDNSDAELKDKNSGDYF